MGAVVVRLRAEMRRRWRGWLSLGLLLGMLGGAELAAIAGARRTLSAYPRYLEQQRAFDQFLLTDEAPPEFGFSPNPEQLRSMPEVSEVASAYFIQNVEDINVVAGDDPAFDRAFNVPTAFRGRLPRSDRPDEAAVPIVVADQLGLDPGDTLKLSFFRADGGAPVERSFTVTGISVAPAELPPGGDIPPPVRLTPAFYDQARSDLMLFRFTFVRLHHGADDLAAFRGRLDALAGGRVVFGFTQHALSKNIQRSFELQASALWVLALVLGAAGLAMIGQALARQTALEAYDYPVLRAMGMSRRQMAGLALMRTALIGCTGAVVAVAVAYAASPLTPRGLARAVETEPGFSFDVVALVGGGAAIVCVALFLGLVPAVLSARRAGAAIASSAPSNAIARTVARLFGSPAATIGARFALEPGRGANAVPVRSTLAGAALALGALALAFTFGAGLDRLLAEPKLYGLSWHLAVFMNEEADPAVLEAAVGKVAAIDGVAAVAPAVVRLPLSIEGQSADGLVLREQDGGFLPPLLSGRLPREPNELVVGPRTSRLIGKGVGDEVKVSSLGGSGFAGRIVGIGVIPPVGHTGNLGEGALASIGVAERLFGSGTFSQVVARLDPGASAESVSGAIKAAFGDLIVSVEPAQTPADIVSFGRDRNLPFALAGVLAIVAAGTIGHLLLTGIARRRRELAVLKAMGFARRQVGAAVAWQATVLVFLALLLGVPLGVAAGRWAWTGYANSLGVIPAPVVPVATVLLIVPAAVVLANVLSLHPARAAARTPTAAVLRSE